MKRLPHSMLIALESWKDRSRDPEFGDDAYNAYYDVVGELPTVFDEGELGNAASGLSRLQRDVGALLRFSNTISFDGLAVGVIVNEPELVGCVEVAAKEHSLASVQAFCEALRKSLPEGLLEVATADDRYDKIENDTDLQESLEELEDSTLMTDARCEMVLKAMQLAAENTEEFFEAS